MKRVIFLAFLILFATSLSTMAVEIAEFGGPNPVVPSFVGYAPNRIVVKFDPSILSGMDKAAMARGRTGIPVLDQVGTWHGVRSLRPQFPGARKTSDEGKQVNLAGWHKVKFSRNVDVLAVVEEYKAIPGVVDAQPVGIHRVSRTPNDPMYSWSGYQWHLPRIQAPEAWDIETGNPAIIVAVLDTGVRYFHKDLGGSNASLSYPTNVAGNMWINPGEILEDMVDNDSNGFVDDWIGSDFVDDPCGQPGPFLCYPCCCFDGEDCLDPDNDPRDFNGHGTHCAGNVSAINNNEYATASPAGGWGSWYTSPFGNGVKVMALRIGWNAVYVFFEVGLVAMDYAAEALYYAANNGARIASCSWGSDSSGGIGAAIDYFVREKGGLIFKAAGNEGTETADFLCASPDVICVAATDQGDCKASFSNYGDWVGISAPGVQVGSLWHQYTDPLNDYAKILDGTSMATPLAASVAALIWSRDPSLSAGDVKNILFGNADSIDSLLCNSPGGKLGAGRINAYKAVLAVGPPPPILTSISVSPSSASVAANGTQPFTATAKDQFGNALESQPVFTWTVSGGGTINGSGLFTAGSTAGGPYTVTAASGGVSGTASVTVTNTPPVITSGPTATQSTITDAQTSTLNVTASDADGDTLSYSWSATGGSVSGTGPTAVYTPPRVTVTTVYSVTVTVSDGRGGSASGSVNVTVNHRRKK